MGFLSDIFGGGGGSADVQQVSTLTPEVRKVYDMLAKTLQQQFSGNQLQGITPFPADQRVATLDPLQQSAFGLAGSLGGPASAGLGLSNQFLGGINPAVSGDFLGQAQNLLGQSTQAYSPENLLKSLEPGRKLALNTFQQDIIPQIKESLGATSSSSGALDKELARAGERLALGLGAQAQPYLFQGEQSALGRQFAGAGQAGNLAQLPGQLASQGLGVGAGASDILSQLANIGSARRGITQQGLTAQQQAFQEAQPYSNPYIQSLAPLVLGTRAFENVITPPSPGLGGATLGALGSIGGGLAQAGDLGSTLGKLFSPFSFLF